MASLICEDGNTGTGLTVVSVGAVDGLLTITNNGLTSTIVINMPNDSMHHYKIWLSDSATDPVMTQHQPDGTLLTQWEGETDSSGNKTITITNNGTARTWYAYAWFAKTNVSGAITAGV